MKLSLYLFLILVLLDRSSYGQQRLLNASPKIVYFFNTKSLKVVEDELSAYADAEHEIRVKGQHRSARFSDATHRGLVLAAGDIEVKLER